MIDLKQSDFILRQNERDPDRVVDVFAMTEAAEDFLDRLRAPRCPGCGQMHLTVQNCDEFTAICDIADLSWEIGLPPTH